MDEKRKQLADYFESLELPFTREQMMVDFTKFSEDEIDFLLLSCRELESFDNGMEDELKLRDPEKYNELKREYLGKKLQIMTDANKKLEDSQRIYDEEMDKIEAEERKLEDSFEEDFLDEEIDLQAPVIAK